MKADAPRTVLLGDLVVAAFDEAAQYSTDPLEVSRLAAGAVMHALWRRRRRSFPSKRPPSLGGGGGLRLVSQRPPRGSFPRGD
jgi:hypothetical protein